MFNDQGLAAEVSQLEDRLDEMREQLELWVLRARGRHRRPVGPPRVVAPRASAAEEIGDAAQQLVWLVEQEEEMHPVLSVALGEADEVVVQYPIAPGSELDGATAHVVAARRRHRLPLARDPRGGRYVYRPRGRVDVAGRRRDARHRSVGRARRARASQCGFRLVEDDDTGAIELVPPGK